MRGTTAGALLGMMAVCAVGSAAAHAAPVVAIVEEIGAAHGVEAMDSLTAGQMIMLKPGEHLVLNYTTSCMHETITGGVVSIGTEQSIVVGGEVKRERVECDGGKALLTADQANHSAVMVFRNVKLGASGKAPPSR